MKTLIVPTDFSESAQNATEYAAALAKTSNASLNLLHAFHLPVEIDGALVRLTSLQDLSRKKKLYLKDLATKISLKYDIKVESHAYPGFITHILQDYVKKRKGDLVVMGMRGMSKIERLLFGSVTTNILMKADFPLLIVPAKSKFHPIKNILLACDYHGDAINDKIALVKDSALIFNAEVRVLHICKPLVGVAELEERITTGKLIERVLKGVRHSFIDLEEEDIVEGIQSNIKSQKTDLLVMIPRKRSFWQSLTSRSNTNRITFDIDIPLLALPHSGN